MTASPCRHLFDGMLHQSIHDTKADNSRHCACAPGWRAHGRERVRRCERCWRPGEPRCAPRPVEPGYGTSQTVCWSAMTHCRPSGAGATRSPVPIEAKRTKSITRTHTHKKHCETAASLQKGKSKYAGKNRTATIRAHTPFCFSFGGLMHDPRQYAPPSCAQSSQLQRSPWRVWAQSLGTP